MIIVLGECGLSADLLRTTLRILLKETFISNDLVQLWIVLSIVDSGADVPVSRNMTGRGMVKENFVGIRWSTVYFSLNREIHTKYIQKYIQNTYKIRRWEAGLPIDQVSLLSSGPITTEFSS